MMKEQPMIRERRFVAPLRFYPHMKEEIENRGWTALVNPCCGCKEIVQEFYSNAWLANKEEEHSSDHHVCRSRFKGTEIDFSAAAIRALLEIPEHDPCEGHLSFHELLHPSIHKEIANSIVIAGAGWHDNALLLAKHLACEARVWSQFVLETVMPACFTDNLNYEEALLIFCIMK